jgi:hypothetical protein
MPGTRISIPYLFMTRHVSANLDIHPVALACEAKTMYFLGRFSEIFQ